MPVHSVFSSNSIVAAPVKVKLIDGERFSEVLLQWMGQTVKTIRTCKRTYSSGRLPPLSRPSCPDSVCMSTTKARPVFCSLVLAEVTCFKELLLSGKNARKLHAQMLSCKNEFTLLYPWKCNLGRLLCTTNLLPMMSMYCKPNECSFFCMILKISLTSS